MTNKTNNRFKNDPDGTRLPIKLDTCTNGEYLPRPLPEHVRKTIHTATNWASENAKRLNQGRREFLVSLSGAATCLLAMNRASAAVGQTGGLFDIPEEAALDIAKACPFLDVGGSLEVSELIQMPG